MWYDTDSPLKDANCILYLAVTWVTGHVSNEVRELSGSSPPVPSLRNVLGLATTGLESCEVGEWSEEKEELVLRLDILRALNKRKLFLLEIEIVARHSVGSIQFMKSCFRSFDFYFELDSVAHCLVFKAFFWDFHRVKVVLSNSWIIVINII